MILAFDTSGAYCATALLDGDTILAARHEDMAKGQAERLIPLIEGMLAEVQVTLQDLTAIGVGVGPGNFTGIRISVSAARGLALALGIPAVGVSTLEALAQSVTSPVLTSVDARQGKVYTQCFNVGKSWGPSLSLPQDAPLPPSRAEVDVIGHEAEALAARTGGRVLTPHDPIAQAVACIAAKRMHRTNLPRPAPLYIRAADAAPSREQGPKIL